LCDTAGIAIAPVPASAERTGTATKEFADQTVATVDLLLLVLVDGTAGEDVFSEHVVGESLTLDKDTHCQRTCAFR